MMNWKVAAAGAALAVAVAGPAYDGPTLDSVKQKGFVQCGVNTALAGFGAPTRSRARDTAPGGAC